MRTIFLLPLTLLAVAAGCGSQPAEQATGSVPKRDLTLATQTLEVKAASLVEVKPARIPTRSLRPSRRAAAPRRTPVAELPLVDAATPSPVLPVSEPAVQPVVALPANDRELLPGKTVTLIPVSSGPSAGPDETDELPTARGRTMGRRGGGKCGGRGRGPDITSAPDFQ